MRSRVRREDQVDEHPCVTSNNDLVLMRLRPKGLRSLRFGEAAFLSNNSFKTTGCRVFQHLLAMIWERHFHKEALLQFEGQIIELVLGDLVLEPSEDLRPRKQLHSIFFPATDE